MPLISDLKNIHLGDDCFVIGNGPSVRDFDLNKIINKYVIVSNCFHEHDVWPKLKHVYHVELNGALWSSKEAVEWKIKKLLLNKNVKYILRKRFRDAYLNTSLPRDRMYFLKLLRNRSLQNYEWDISRGSVWANSGVIEGSMALAQYMGFKNIYLIGCDATPYIDKNGSRDNAYFYDWSKTPSVYWPRESDNKDYLNMIESWKIINELFKKRGINVYNLSKYGNLNFLEYKKFDDIL